MSTTSYWAALLDGAPVVAFTPDRAPEAERASDWRTVHVPVSARAAAVTFELFATAAAVLLSRWSRQDEVVIGASDAEGSCWPLRVRVGNGTTDALVARTKTALGEARANPLSLDAITAAAGGLPPFTFAAATTGARIAKAHAVVRRHGDGIALDYDAALFDEATATSIARSFTVLLDAMGTSGERSARDLSVVDGAHAAELLELSCGAVVDEPFAMIDSLVRAQAERAPDAIAIQQRDRSISYGELVTRANRLARWLRDRVKQRNARIGIFLERSPEFIIAELAVWTAGFAFVPFDSTTPPARVAEILALSDAALVLTSEEGAALLADSNVDVAIAKHVESESESRPASAPEVARHPMELAYVIFTSGSTGVPKGVAIQHSSLTNMAHMLRRRAGIRPGDRLTQLSSLAFDNSIVEVWRALIAGATSVIVGDELRLSPAELVDWFAREQITHTGLPAALFEAALQEDWTRTKLRRVSTGLEKIPPLSRSLPFPVPYGYGPTECTVGATLVEDIRRIEGAPPIGRPLDNVRVYVLDDDQRPVPRGALGELCIGGANVGRGYLRGDLTAERFVPDPFGEPGSRMYRTGDVARWRSDGLLHFHGRVDEQLKLRGYRVEPAEIEAAIAALPDVREAATVVTKTAAGSARLDAYVVAKEGSPRDAAAVATALKKRLPAYMIPTSIVFVDAMPLTTSGKVDRKALAKIAPPESASSAAPRTAVEAVVAKIFSEVLGTKTVSASSDFFALGGHSLLATRVVALVERDLGVTLPIHIVFEAPTVSALAARIEHAFSGETTKATSAPRIVAGEAGDALVPSFAQDGLAAWERSRDPSTVFLSACVVMFTGDIDLDQLRAALRHVLQRHASLRTRVDVRSGSVPSLRLASVDEAEIEVFDVRGSPDPDAHAKQLAIDAHAPFALAGELPLRIRLIRVAADRVNVAIVTHHLLADNESQGIFARDLARTYERLAKHERLETAPGPLFRYSDYAHWERAWFTGAGAAHVDRARRSFTGVRPLELPTDRPRGGPLSLDANEGYAKLGPEERRAIFATARAEAATPSMLLAVGTAALLRAWSGATVVPIGGLTDVRPLHPELADVVGRFFNVMGMVVDVSGDPTVRELLQRVRPANVDAFELRDVPANLRFDDPSPLDCVHNRVMLNGPIFIAEPPLLVDTPSLRVALRKVPMKEGARNELTLSVWLVGDGLTLSVRGARSLYDESTMTAMAEAFGRALLACESNARLSDVLRAGAR